MKFLNTKYKHIIWDWNGTLLDDVDTVIAVMNSLLKKRNMKILDRKKYLDIFDFPVINYYIDLGFDFNIEPFESISNEYIKAYNIAYPSCKLQQHAEKALNFFNESGISQSILSASHQEILEESIDFYNIKDYFIKLIGLQDHYAVSKVENGRRWIKELSLNPSDVLLIGDTTHDYEVANAMGCDCLLLSCGHQSVDKLRRCGVPVLNSLGDILT